MGLVDFELSDVGGIFTSLREAITGEKIVDPTKLAEIDLMMSQVQNKLQEGQIAINKIEASHANVFVSGWRPFIGWTCGAALAYAFVLQPLIEWGVAIFDITREIDDGAGGYINIPIETPRLNVDTLYQLVLAMLGMATLRTYEKKNDVARM